MNKLLILIVCTLFVPIYLSFLPNVSAEQQTLGTFELNKCVNLLQTCSNCSYNNISSVLYPNSSQTLSNVLMTKSGTKFNYSFCSTNVSGEYIVNGFGNPDGVTTVWAYTFTVNPTGIPASPMRTEAITRTIYIIFIMAVVMFVAFIYVKNPPAKWSLFIVSMTFVVITINLLFVSLTNEVTTQSMLTLFDVLSAVSFYFYWFAGGMLFIIWVLTIFNTMWELYGKKNYDKYGGVEGGAYG